MEDRGESIWTMMFRMMGQQIPSSKKQTPQPFVRKWICSWAYFDKNRCPDPEAGYGRQFEDRDGAMASLLEGPGGSTLITNMEVGVLKVLAECTPRATGGSASSTVAGHMPDIDKRLRCAPGRRVRTRNAGWWRGICVRKTRVPSGALDR